MSRRIKSYTDQFKVSAIKLALNSESIYKPAKELSTPSSTLHTWVSTTKNIGEVAISINNGAITNTNVKEVTTKNLELKKRITRLEKEKAILKRRQSTSQQSLCEVWFYQE